MTPDNEIIIQGSNPELSLLRWVLSPPGHSHRSWKGWQNCWGTCICTGIVEAAGHTGIREPEWHARCWILVLYSGRQNTKDHADSQHPYRCHSPPSLVLPTPYFCLVTWFCSMQWFIVKTFEAMTYFWHGRRMQGDTKTQRSRARVLLQVQPGPWEPLDSQYHTQYHLSTTWFCQSGVSPSSSLLLPGVLWGMINVSFPMFL